MLSSGISWYEQWGTCAALVSGVCFGRIRGPGEWWGMHLWTDIPRFSCGPLSGRWSREQEREFCANRAPEYQFNYHFPEDFSFMWVVWCELELKFVICPVHGCQGAQESSLTPSMSFSDLQLYLLNWILCWHLTSGKHIAPACHTKCCSHLCPCVDLPSRVVRLTAKRWGFPLEGWWRWSSQPRNLAALDCAAPQTPAERHQTQVRMYTSDVLLLRQCRLKSDKSLICLVILFKDSFLLRCSHDGEWCQLQGANGGRILLYVKNIFKLMQRAVILGNSAT